VDCCSRNRRSCLRSRNPLYRPETPPMISVSTRLDRIVGFEAQKRLPTIYQFREYAVAGGLISYGPNFAESYKNAGTYVGRILKGEKPADLPVMQPTKF
jgi:putative tryptophan/tyrosine transport system substrate-binding protein